MVQHRAVRAYRGARLSEVNAVGELMRRKAELADFWRDQVKLTKRRRRPASDVQRFVGVTSNQALGNPSSRLSNAAVPPPTVVADVELEIPERQIAAFESFLLD